MTGPKPTSAGSVQCMCSNLNVSVRSHQPISKSEPSQPIADTHLSRLYLQFHSFTHYAKLMTKVEGWNGIYIPIMPFNSILYYLLRSVVAFFILPVPLQFVSMCINTALA